MSDIQLMQEQYEIGNDRAVVDAATEDGLIGLAFTFDKIAKGLEALSVHISPKNEAIDPENYSALREIVELDLDSANRDLAEKGLRSRFHQINLTGRGAGITGPLPQKN